MIYIYIDKNILNYYNCVPLIAPIVPNSTNFGWYNGNYQLEKWKTEGKKFIKLSNIENCDFCVFPINYRVDFFDILKSFVDYANGYNKKVIVFYNTDNELEIPLNNVIVFRTSMTKDFPVNEMPYPTFPDSLRREHIFKKNNKISIGYAGYVGTLGKGVILLEKIRQTKFFKKMMIFLFYKIKVYKLIVNKLCINPKIKGDILAFLLGQKGKQNFYRGQVLEQLKKSKYRFNFIKREHVLNPSEIGKQKEEYINNIYDSTFTLVVRGYGNHAHRLYETMSTGKIPLFIDTNSRIPFDDEIDYKQYFVYIPFNDLNNLDNYIESFLKKNGNNLYKIETKIRDIYLDYFVMNKYFPKLLKIILDKIN